MARPEQKLTRKNYLERPEIKQKRKIWYKEYNARPEVKEWRKKYHQLPEVIKMRKKKLNEYLSNPKNKKKYLEYQMGLPSCFFSDFKTYLNRIEMRYTPCIREKVIDKKAIAELYVSQVCQISGEEKCKKVDLLLSKIKTEGDGLK
jgi:hypothetical protein